VLLAALRDFANAIKNSVLQHRGQVIFSDLRICSMLTCTAIHPLCPSEPSTPRVGQFTRGSLCVLVGLTVITRTNQGDGVINRPVRKNCRSRLILQVRVSQPRG
jgi:hypothetical protein